MLLMASSGFAVANVVHGHPEMLTRYAGTDYHLVWHSAWSLLAYELSHVTWTGCSLWDLIQPSFMFMVGVAMPFSYGKRQAGGQSQLRMLWHVIVRSLILILLAVFLSSNSSQQTNFVFTNVLAQIGLGYTFVYLLYRCHFVIQLIALAGILSGYGYYSYQYTIPKLERQQVETYLADELKLNPHEELEQFDVDSVAAHWNKHTNLAAAVDRRLLSRYPREEKAWNGRTYWVNRGGYQTLNFIPSMATMLFGVLAGGVLRSSRSDNKKLLWLLIAGSLCFVVSMAVDTSIWSFKVPGGDWSFCPIVKRIWTPSWAVFSAGWAFWMLAGFYWLIDVHGYRKWAFPLVVVGMNSIAMYCMSQLTKTWVGESLKRHLRVLDSVLDVNFGWNPRLAYYLFSDSYPFADIWRVSAVLFVLWLVCLWLYRRRIFIRI